MWVGAIVLMLALLAPSFATASAPKPEHTIILGSKPIVAPSKGATLTCKAAEGGCTVFSPNPSAVYPSGFVVPEHGGIVAVAIGREPVDNYNFNPVLARPSGGGLLIEEILSPVPPFEFPWGAVGPASGPVGVFPAPPTGGFSTWDQPGYEAKKGELVGLKAIGIGPSLEADPGRTSLGFKPAVARGATALAGPLDLLPGLSLQMQVVLEREAALRAYSAWAFPDAVEGFRQGVPFDLVVTAQNTSRKAAARDVVASIDLSGRPFKALKKRPAPCRANICRNVGTIGAVGQAKARPYGSAKVKVLPTGRGKGRIGVLFETQTIENDQAKLANNRGAIQVRFKRKRGQGGGGPNCGRLRLGTPRPDRLNGTARRDTLVGLQGADRLRGRGASDCIAGSAGPDRIWGNAGNDVILGDDQAPLALGKPGGDRIVPGGGRDYVDAGGGNDLIISRDGRPDTVDCGPGRDRVVADRADRLSGCEIRR